MDVGVPESREYLTLKRVVALLTNTVSPRAPFQVDLLVHFSPRPIYFTFSAGTSAAMVTTNLTTRRHIPEYRNLRSPYCITEVPVSLFRCTRNGTNCLAML